MLCTCRDNRSQVSNKEDEYAVRVCTVCIYVATIYVRMLYTHA